MAAFKSPDAKAARTIHLFEQWTKESKIDGQQDQLRFVHCSARSTLSQGQTSQYVRDDSDIWALGIENDIQNEPNTASLATRQIW